MTPNSTKEKPKRGRKRKPINDAALLLARRMVDAGHKTLHTWDATAAHYGISKAAAHRLANDPGYRPSQATIDKVLAAPRPQRRTVSVPACPDCGSVHHARCNGNHGTAVVLAPGQQVTTKKPRRYSRIADMPVSMLARAVKERYDAHF